MSKIEKQISKARAWRQKHPEAGTAFAALDGALTAWDAAEHRVAALKADLEVARSDVETTLKSVKKAFKDAKAIRRAAKEPKAKKVKDVQP